MFRLLYLLPFLMACATLSPTGKSRGAKVQRLVAHSTVFEQAFTGFSLFDPESGKTLADWNGSKYFTPASNTKILTLYSCLKVLGDSIPALEYAVEADTLYLRGLADPTFLNPNFNAWQGVFEKLDRDSARQLVHVRGIWQEKRYGPGWSWDDFTENYSPERHELPIYGDMMRIVNNADPDKRRVFPAYLEAQLSPRDLQSRYPLHGFNYRPEDHAGYTNFWPETKDSIYEQPIIFLHLSPWELLEDSLSGRRNILELDENDKLPWKRMYSTPVDTVFRRMMYESDNFVAEQLLLSCAGQKFGLLRQDSMIRWVRDSSLRQIPQPLKWVDGSGLSRYNLMTPQSLVFVLNKLWKEQNHERLLSLFPAGGQRGTIENWYAGKDGKPYVFAKTGSMSGVHCLSGYLRAKSGKMLIFSFMHNNFTGSNRKWKEEMQRILEKIAEQY